MIRSYKDLNVWQRARALVGACYAIARALPREERDGLRSQLTRAAVSVCVNIAEGHSRLHRGDYLRHVSVAEGSVSEVETLLVLIADLGFAPAADVERAQLLAGETSRMLIGLIIALRRAPANEGV